MSLAPADKYANRTSSGAFSVKRIRGFYARETAGAAASFNIRRNDVSGTIVVPCNLAANGAVGEGQANFEGADDWYLEVLSGAVSVSVAGSS